MKRIPPSRSCVRLISALFLLFSFGIPASANDAPGCSDPTGLKRYSGSSLVLCEKRDFDAYVLPTGKNTAFDFDTNKAEFESSLTVEGRVSKNVYAVPSGVSSLDVLRNYEADLTSKGYKTLFKAEASDTGPYLGAYFQGNGPGTQIWAYSPDQARYLAAVKEDGASKTYVALYIVEYQDGYEPKFSPEKGEAMVRLDTVQVGEIKDRMVLVSAADISKDIAADGKVTLYGILFDFNKATIKPESRPTLDEIAKYLKQSPGQNVYLIGHTDNVGGFDFNMKLSKARAAAVVNDLSQTYQINKARMIPGGVGLQAPVAPNATEEGRAKNRRVEMLPQ
jgi:OmpA-OmpF porin, OOP family